MGKWLYAQVVMISRKYFDNKKEIYIYIYIYNFQGQSARLILWFDLNHERLEENFRKRGRYIYKNSIKKILGVMIKNISIICSTNW